MTDRKQNKNLFTGKPQIFRTMLSVIAALLVYEAGKAAGLLLAGILLEYGMTGGAGAGAVNEGLAGGLTNLIMILTGGLVCFAVWKSSLDFRIKKKPAGKRFLAFILLAVSLSLGLNIIIAYLDLARHSQTFQQVAQQQASLPLWLGICLFGAAAPLSEELVFRGIIYGKSKEVFGASVAMVFSGVVFGLYHGNLVQGIYASLLGIMLAWIKERYGTLLAPVIFHGAGNLAVFLLINVAGLGSVLAQPLVCAGLLAVSGISFWYLSTRNAAA
nr:type II CAAX endopeptidase family protein [uncultured Eisenbergiella sp.]